MPIKNDLLNRQRVATKKAFDNVKKMNGTRLPPELEIYQRLTPVEFENIKNVYGEEGLMRYIKHMEAKKLKGDNNG